MDPPLSLPPEASRRRVVLFLALLTSDAWRAAAPERTAFALCRLWFDEVYTPGLRYLDGLKGDRSEAAVRHFEAAFTEAEREALARFHRFLELRVDMLPERDRHRGVFPENDAWRSLLRDAAYLLDVLTPDADGLRRTVAALVVDAPERRPLDWLVAAATSPGGPSPRP